MANEFIVVDTNEQRKGAEVTNVLYQSPLRVGTAHRVTTDVENGIVHVNCSTHLAWKAPEHVHLYMNKESFAQFVAQMCDTQAELDKSE